MTLLVRDEEDVIDANLSYHLRQGVDFVIVTDNRSCDTTPHILDRYAAEGRVRVLREDGDDYDQAAWVTRMARLAATDHGADWVINADADEFWWPKWGNLKTALAGLPARVAAVEVGRTDFVPTEDEAGPFHQRLIVREARTLNLFGDPLQPKVCHRASATVEVEQGNHGVSGVAGSTCPQRESPLFILHYPLRSYDRYEHKIVVGGQAYERNTKLPWGTGSGWRTRYDDYRAGRLKDWWNEQVVEQAAIDRGIASGRLIMDRRLQVFFAASDQPGRSGTQPASSTRIVSALAPPLPRLDRRQDSPHRGRRVTVPKLRRRAVKLARRGISFGRRLSARATDRPTRTRLK